MQDDSSRLTDSVHEEFYIGNVKADSGMIEALEREIIGSSLSGRLGKVYPEFPDSSIPWDEFAENVRHVLELNLNNKKLGCEFRTYKTDSHGYIGSIVAVSKALDEYAKIEFKVKCNTNIMELDVEFENATEATVTNVERAVNEVIKNAQLNWGW